MQEQNYKNHSRYVPVYHFILTAIVLGIDVLAVTKVVFSVICHSGRLESALLFLIAMAISIIAWLVRRFPIAVQNRAIRAEENLRHFALTGKLLDKKLTMGQIVALRFAPDEEFVALAERATKEGLSNKEIKLAVKNWRADNHRA